MTSKRGHERGLRLEVILDGARETLVLLRIVVLEADLQVNGLKELPLLILQQQTIISIKLH